MREYNATDAARTHKNYKLGIKHELTEINQKLEFILKIMMMKSDTTTTQKTEENQRWQTG